MPNQTKIKLPPNSTLKYWPRIVVNGQVVAVVKEITVACRLRHVYLENGEKAKLQLYPDGEE